MTKEKLQEYIIRNSDIDFNYNGKRYGIEMNAQIDGKSVIDILAKIDDADVV